ncbi:SOS response-associated peptidase [Leptolyngbya sp. 7M]|uniref:SOS response-associated peptidase n=1 Tax=Leptolyngbya sp. 7M TaxID=2812896 RepID=UPI001B8C8003|nr:SOS response-associated peptidase family protein [Leptolyngbya sp. 7M]QYO68214.1 SOS response-associated peptidase [Leptolyngbya sp. 7M]
MCGRYKLATNRTELQRAFPWLDDDEYFDLNSPFDRGEIFPGTDILVFNKYRKAETVHWTIRDRTWDGKIVSAINAKAENVRKVGMFRGSFQNDRVLIPASSLYEWQQQPDKSKKKFEIWFDEPLFAFAGIARECEINGERRRCAAILTTHPNDIFREIHNSKQRQAVVIRQEDHEKWIDQTTALYELQRMMQPLRNEETHAKAIEE